VPDQSPIDVQQDRPYSGTVTAAGTLTVTVTPSSSTTWEITQITTEMTTAPAGAICVIRKNGLKVTDMIGSGDAAGGDPPVILRPADRLTVEWASCTPGDTGTVGIFYNQYPRGRR
jgi:hypothetical protein